MAFKIVKEFAIDMTGAASAAKELDIGSFTSAPDTQINIRVADTDAVIKFGDDNTVVADETITLESFAAGNFTIPSGGFGLYGIVDDNNWISVISLDGSSTGTVYVTVGYGEKI